jgi:hypothetical protein
VAKEASETTAAIVSSAAWVIADDRQTVAVAD